MPTGARWFEISFKGYIFKNRSPVTNMLQCKLHCPA